MLLFRKIPKMMMFLRLKKKKNKEPRRFLYFIACSFNSFLQFELKLSTSVAARQLRPLSAKSVLLTDPQVH
jgi:hypothetical protein